MNKITIVLTILVVILGFCFGTTMQSKAQIKNFTGAVPFMTSNGRLGFFDQSNGMIYIYDDNLSQCLFVGQLSALGSPIQAVTKSQP